MKNDKNISYNLKTFKVRTSIRIAALLFFLGPWFMPIWADTFKIDCQLSKVMAEVFSKRLGDLPNFDNWDERVADVRQKLKSAGLEADRGSAEEVLHNMAKTLGGITVASVTPDLDVDEVSCPARETNLSFISRMCCQGNTIEWKPKNISIVNHNCNLVTNFHINRETLNYSILMSSWKDMRQSMVAGAGACNLARNDPKKNKI